MQIVIERWLYFRAWFAPVELSAHHPHSLNKERIFGESERERIHGKADDDDHSGLQRGRSAPKRVYSAHSAKRGRRAQQIFGRAFKAGADVHCLLLRGGSRDCSPRADAIRSLRANTAAGWGRVRTRWT